jgi:hypothetical protein
MALYAVSNTGRIALGELLKDVKYVQAEKTEDGAVVLTPIRIVPATGKATEPVNVVDPATPDYDDEDDDEPPFGA